MYICMITFIQDEEMLKTEITKEGVSNTWKCVHSRIYVACKKWEKSMGALEASLRSRRAMALGKKMHAAHIAKMAKKKEEPSRDANKDID